MFYWTVILKVSAEHRHIERKPYTVLSRFWSFFSAPWWVEENCVPILEFTPARHVLRYLYYTIFFGNLFRVLVYMQQISTRLCMPGNMRRFLWLQSVYCSENFMHTWLIWRCIAAHMAAKHAVRVYLIICVVMYLLTSGPLSVLLMIMHCTFVITDNKLKLKLNLGTFRAEILLLSGVG